MLHFNSLAELFRKRFLFFLLVMVEIFKDLNFDKNVEYKYYVYQPFSPLLIENYFDDLPHAFASL